MAAERNSTASLEILLEEEFDRLDERLKREEEKGRAVPWGGFFRRACAFSIDLLALSVLSLVLFYFAYVGYSVGLAAHHQALSEKKLDVFLFFLLLGWFSLVVGYFVLFHGMGGQTIGKWLLGLRVVGANREPITYRQALIRCGGMLVSAFLGLGFLWVLFSREKRGWHDLLARTWVIRGETHRLAQGHPQVLEG